MDWVFWGVDENPVFPQLLTLQPFLDPVIYMVKISIDTWTPSDVGIPFSKFPWSLKDT